jgi:hypothetical protein
MVEIQARLLHRAISIAGGEDRLATKLHVPEHGLRLWLENRARLPDYVFLVVVDLILADDEAWAAQDRRIQPREHEQEPYPYGQPLSGQNQPAQNDGAADPLHSVPSIKS